MRTELADHTRATNLPTMLVTHDFDDAVALADRVGVLIDGKLRQIGTPAELVAAPADAFVANLTGVNLLTGTASAGDDGLTRVVLDDGVTIWSSDGARGRVNVAIAPWEIAVGHHDSDDSARNAITAPVRSVAHFGNRARIAIGPLVAEITGAAVAGLGLAPGDVAVATFKATATRLLPIDAP
jgi:ABC-type sulfate/molybdate transport systems ATPase subunit